MIVRSTEARRSHVLVLHRLFVALATVIGSALPSTLLAQDTIKINNQGGAEVQVRRGTPFSIQVVPTGTSYEWVELWRLEGTTPVQVVTSLALDGSAPQTLVTTYNGSDGLQSRLLSDEVRDQDGTPIPLAFGPNVKVGDPNLKLNGGTSNITVAPGQTFTVRVENPPTFANDWIALYRDTDGTKVGDGWFLNGSSIPPQEALGTVDIEITAPSVPGTYKIEFHEADNERLLKTSAYINVEGPPPPPPAITINGHGEGDTIYFNASETFSRQPRQLSGVQLSGADAPH